MSASNLEAHRAGHEAFNQRDFEAMTRQYADSISWTDHSQGRTFRTPQEFKDDFLTGWIGASPPARGASVFLRGLYATESASRVSGLTDDA